MSKQNVSVADAPISLENIQKLYDMDFAGAEGRQKVEEFIQANPELVPLLEEAHEVILTHFPDGEPFLRMENLDEPAENHHLTAYIRPKMSGKEAVAPSRAIDDNWLFLLPLELSKKFDIDLYFI